MRRRRLERAARRRQAGGAPTSRRRRPVRPAAIVPMSALVVAAALLAPGCSSSKSSSSSGAAPAGPPPIGRVERQRGIEACRAYVARVCACAKTHPDEAKACRLARVRPEALEMSLGAASSGGNVKPQDRAVAIYNARKIIQACFQADARLDPARCPRVPVTSPSSSPRRKTPPAK